MQQLQIGFVPLARSTFDTALAGEVTRKAQEALIQAGFILHGPSEPVSDLAGAEEAAAGLADHPIDLLIIFQATFTDSTLAMALSHHPSPVLLWAVPEDRTGGRLRLNSLCGINLAAHALRRCGRRYQHLYLRPNEAEAVEHIRNMAQAGQVVRNLRQARLGVIGEHPPGMDSCYLDEAELQSRFGLQVCRYSLSEVFERARQVSAAQTAAVRSMLTKQVDGLSALDQTPLNGSLNVYRALLDLAHTEQLDGLAVRCWPEFFTELGCAACGAMSMLSDGMGQAPPLPCSCEADANGTVTQMILSWLSDGPAFGSDLVEVNPQENSAVLWHCGLAPVSMADPTYQPRAGLHSNRRLPLVMEFPLKPGAVTLARLSQTGDSCSPLRLVVGCGEMLSAPPSFSGTSGVLRFERTAGETLDTILREGLEHHISLVYGNHLPALLALAELLELPVLRL
jgi:L-fucose isomerase-like protein